MPPPRRFDHDEAQRLHTQGVTVYELSKRYGVSYSSVRRVVDPEFRQKQKEVVRRCQLVPCPRCGKQITGRYRPGSLCRSCLGVDQRVTVREDTLRCSECGDWRPDVEFPYSRRKGSQARRQRHSVCRDCAPAARQRARKLRLVPCRNCGKPRLHPKDGSRKTGGTGLCRSCYQASRKVAA